MATAKPDMTRIWASGAPAPNIVDPDTTTPGKFASGWLAEVPPFEHFNFIQQFVTQANAYNNEQGVNGWDSNTVYPIGGFSKGSNSELYRALTEQSANDPTIDDGTNWEPIKLAIEQKQNLKLNTSLANLTTGINNLAINTNALCALTTGCDNIVAGVNAASSLTTANCVISIGNNSLATNVTGSQIIAIGHNVFNQATSPRCSVAIGFNIGSAATTACFNTIVGNNAAQCLTTGFCNAIFGRDAAVFITSAHCIAAFGLEALQQVTSGCANAAFGMEAGRCITTGNYNVALGTTAMLGSVGGITGDFNLGAVCLALNSLSTGSGNIGLGRQAGGSTNTGNNNVFAGYFSAFANTSGSDNVFLGTCSALSNTTGARNFIAGFCSSPTATNMMDSIVIGTCAARIGTSAPNSIIMGLLAGYNVTNTCNSILLGQCTGSPVDTHCNISIGFCAGILNTIGNNVINIGTCANRTGSSETCITGCVYIDLHDTSDFNSKCSIKKSRLGIDFVRALSPKEFLYKASTDGGIFESTDDRTMKTQYGFIAQEVKTALDSIGVPANDFAGYVDGGNDATMRYSLKYTQFIAPLWEAVRNIDQRLQLLESN